MCHVRRDELVKDGGRRAEVTRHVRVDRMNEVGVARSDVAVDGRLVAMDGDAARERSSVMRRASCEAPSAERNESIVA